MDPDLVRRWCEAGRLPTIAGCIERGVCGRLLSTYNQLTASAWVTVATGANPGAHGLYNFQERVPGKYELKLPTTWDRKLPAFWELASEAGLQAATARVPMTYPIRPINGIGVADGLAPSPESPGFTHPPELAKDLVRRLDYSFWGDHVGDASPKSARQYGITLQNLLRGVDAAYRLFEYLLSLQQTDILFGVVNDTDVAGHLFWHFQDPTHPRHGIDSSPQLKDALLSVYERVDRGLGELLDGNEFHGNVLLISDHGMGAHTFGPNCVAALLEAAGLMVKDESVPQRSGLLSQARNAIVRRIPWHIRRRLRPLDERTRARGFTAQLLSDIDFARSRAFSYLSIQTGEIWLNIRGRDPEGIVAPGAEADELCDYITELFMEARDPETGERPVVEVKRRDEIFTGEHMDVIPDIHVKFRDGLHVSGLTTKLADGSKVTVSPPEDTERLPSGFHRPYGIFIACGPDIKPSAQPLEGTLMDIAPTALALLGVPIPSHMEGRVLSEALADSVTPRYTDAEPQDAKQAPEAGYSEEEMAQVEKRLKDLGYM